MMGCKDGVIYNSGQIRNVFQWMKRDPKFMILGGPADGNEAQTAVAKWPELKGIGFEPHHGCYIWQLNNGWPKDWRLFGSALSSCSEVGTLFLSDDERNGHRASSLQGPREGGRSEQCVMTTLDDSLIYLLDQGLEDVLLWLDIEGWELEALKGGVKLFESGAVRWCNVEFMDWNKDINAEVDKFLRGYGLTEIHPWDVREGLATDMFYVRP